MNVDTGSNESHHKGTKVAAKLTQKNVNTFETQTDQRLEEFHLLDLAMCELDGDSLWEYFDMYAPPEALASPTATPDHPTFARKHVQMPDADDADGGEDDPEGGEAAITGSTIQVYWNEEEGDVAWRFVGSRMKNQDKIMWDNHVVDYLFHVQELVHPRIKQLEICCEHKRNGQIFRGHPTFGKKVSGMTG